MNLQEAVWQHRAPDADGDCNAPLIPWNDYQHANALKPGQNESKHQLSAFDRFALFVLAAAILTLLSTL